MTFAYIAEFDVCTETLNNRRIFIRIDAHARTAFYGPGQLICRVIEIGMQLQFRHLFQHHTHRSGCLPVLSVERIRIPFRDKLA